jgi:hypothetical protein
VSPSNQLTDSAPATPRELAHLLAAFAVTAVDQRRELTLARFAILVEAAIRPQLRRTLGEAAARIREWGTATMRTVGSSHPARDIALLGNQVDALTLHQLAYPDPDFDPEPALLALVAALIADRN